MTSWPAHPDTWSYEPGCEPSYDGPNTPGTHRVLRVGPLTIDTDAHTASLHDKRLDLRQMEYNLLVHLASDPRRVFRKHELLRAVWGYHVSVSTRTLDSHASRLRCKLATRRRTLDYQRPRRGLSADLSHAAAPNGTCTTHLARIAATCLAQSLCKA